MKINFTLPFFPTDLERLYKQIKDFFLSSDDGDYVISIDKIRKTRSLNQNKYYWGVIIPILGSDLGYEKDFMHEILKSLFLKPEVIKNPLDKRRKIVREVSTSILDTKEFTNFIDKIRGYFSEHRIPAPDSKEALEAYDFYLSRY